MASIKKFEFDTSFDIEEVEACEPEPEEPDEEEPEEPVPEPTFSAEEVARARSEGFAEGRNAALSEAGSSVERMAAEALSAIGVQLGALERSLNTATERRERGAVAVAAAIARKAVPAIARASAVATVETLVRDCLPRVMDEPRVVIRVSDALIDTIQSRLGAMAADSGFGGEVILVGDASLKRSDCRVEWADGGAEFDSTQVWDEIDAAVARFLESAAPAPPPGDSAADADGPDGPPTTDAPLQ